MILSNYKRSFTLLIAGQLISVLGNGLSRFTIIWWLALQFNSGALVAQQLIASTLPGIVLAPLIGPLVDRLPRKRVMLLVNMLQIILVAGLCWLFAEQRITMGWLLVYAAPASVLGAIVQPALIATCSQMCRIEKQGNLAGLQEILNAVGMIISPIIAAVLLKYWSPERILWIDLLTFVVAVVSLLVIRKFPIQDLQTERQQPAWRQHLSLLAEGFRFVYERKGLRMLLLLFLIINVGCAIQPVLPLFVTRVLMKGAEAFAQLELVFGLGLIIGNIGMTVIGRIRNQVLAIVGGLVVGGVLELTIGLQQELWMTVLIAFLFGIVLPVINASSTAIWLESVPNALQGRVFSIRASVAQTGIPIGYLLNGYLSDLYGPSFVFVVGGLLLILISILALGSDSFRNLNQRSATKIYNAKEN